MMELLLGVALGGLVGLGGVLTGCWMTGGFRRAEKAEQKAEEVAPARDEKEEREEAQRSREIEEGFTNLMTYSVNGNDGFGR